MAPPDNHTDQTRMNAFVARIYAEGADDYDRQLMIDCAYRTPAVVAETVGTLAARERWLDIGAGTGLVARALARATTAELYAVDLVQGMLLMAPPELYRSRARSDVTRRLPYTDASFDGVIAASLLEHVVEPELLVAEVARVLSGSGRLVLTFVPNRAGASVLFAPLGGHLSHDARSIRRNLRASGMCIEREIDFDAYRSGPAGWVKSRAVVARRAGARPGRSASVYACPACARALGERGSSLDCSGCGRRYPVVRGIVEFFPLDYPA